MESQFLPNKKRLAVADTTDFSRVESQFLTKFHWSNKWPKLKLHAAEAGGIREEPIYFLLRLKLKLHAAEAGGISIAPVRRADTIALRGSVANIIAVVFVMKGGVVYKNDARGGIAVVKIDYDRRNNMTSGTNP